MVEIQLEDLLLSVSMPSSTMQRCCAGDGCRLSYDNTCPLGARTRSGPFHANMIESWFANDPGLVVLAPGTPQDAYDLLVEAAHLDDPVLFLEHIGLYGLRGEKTGWGQNINQNVDTSSVHASIEQGKRHSVEKHPLSVKVKTLRL